MTIRRNVIAKDKANRAELCMRRQKINRAKRLPMSDEQRLINSLTDRELKRWRLAGKPQNIREIKEAVWPLTDHRWLDDILGKRGVAA